jgi:hypothetical protein
MKSVQSPLSLAISRAGAQAEVRRMEMSRALDASRVTRLLTEQAANARLSPLGSDQLLAIALDAAAASGEFHAPILDALRQPPDPLEQVQLRRQVFAQYDDIPARAVAKAAPDWAVHRANVRVREDPGLLAGWLRAAADLNAELWDHPALPVAPALRGLILACVAPLRQRANAVSYARIQRPPANPSQALREGAAS